MSPLLILAWVAIGFGVGTLSAMLGTGGGLFVAPLLLHYYEHLAGIDQALIAPLAAATSLLSVWVTSLLGGLGHWRHGEVAWREALWAGLTGAVAGWLITWGVATQPGYRPEILRIVLAVIFGMLLVRMLLQSGVRVQRRCHPPGWVPPLVGIAAGVVSPLAGIGGGVVMVPLWYYVGRMEMHRATGTSIASIVPIASVALLVYVVRGWGHAGLPTYSLGYVDWVTALPLLVGSALGAPLGAHLAQRIPAPWLRRIFALVSLGMILYLLRG